MESVFCVSIEAVTTAVNKAAVFWSVRFRDMLMHAHAPRMYLAAAVVSVGCVGPASNVLYSRWESVVLWWSLQQAVITENTTTKMF